MSDGEIDLVKMKRLSDQEVIDQLITYRGVGRWTAEWFLVRTLGRPKVVAGDLVVRKSVGAVYFDGRLPSEEEVRAATAHWGSAGSVAQQVLLHAHVSGR